MSPTCEPASKHTPAWKKLGLKLKFAKDAPDDSRHSQVGEKAGTKRKSATGDRFTFGTAAVEGPSKKHKKSKSSADGLNSLINGNGSLAQSAEDGKPTKTLVKSKSTYEESAKLLDRNGPQHEPVAENGIINKSKKSKSKPKPEIDAVAPHGTVDITSHQANASSLPNHVTPIVTRKAVSFTPDTKIQDGDSVKALYKTWIKNQIANDASFDPSTISPALRSIIPTTITTADSPSPLNSTLTSASIPKKLKKRDKTKKIKSSKTSPPSEPSPLGPALTYLTTYHTSTNWKFSKPHQNHLLRHLFSLNHIPSTYDQSLLSYLRGLKGINARSRIRRQALAIRKDDHEWLEKGYSAQDQGDDTMDKETAAQCNKRRRADYGSAVEHIKATLRAKEERREEREWELLGEREEWELRIRKRKRAEIVLWALGEDEEVVENSIALPNSTIFGNGAVTRAVRVGEKMAAAAAAKAPRLMGGVESISSMGIAKGSQGKKLVFGEDDGVGQENGVNGVKVSAHGRGASSGTPVKRKRKRKRRTTGVPDDESSSESSSSSDESDEVGKKGRGKQVQQKVADVEPSSSDSGWDSDETSSDSN